MTRPTVMTLRCALGIHRTCSRCLCGCHPRTLAGRKCKCRWEGHVPVLVERTPTCINHGDHSEWWQRVQEHARRLHERTERSGRSRGDA